MEYAGLALRSLLACVFAVAAVSKLLDPGGSRRAALDLGASRSLGSLIGVALPVSELAIAILLVPGKTARWALLAALILLVGFSLLIVVNLLAGRRPDCRCFGNLSSRPIGGTALIRNAILAGVAVSSLAIGWGRPAPGPEVGLDRLSSLNHTMPLWGLVDALFLAAVAWLLVHVMAQQGRLLLRMEQLEKRAAGSTSAAFNGSMPDSHEFGLPVGVPAPAFALSTLEGGQQSLTSLLAGGHPVVLLFVDPNCSSCTGLVPDVARWQHELQDIVTLVVVSTGTREVNQAITAHHSIDNFLLQEAREVSDSYRAPGTPSAILVLANGRVGSGVAAGVDAIKGIISDLNAFRSTKSGLASPRVGTPAPSIQLPDLAGQQIHLADYRGRDTAILFWNSSCNFCKSILEDVKTLERQLDAVLIVSSGPPEELRAQGFQSRVFVDDALVVTRAYGVSGTPAALKVDAHGNVASELVEGASAVLSLLSDARVESHRRSLSSQD
jgi:peroxiredoxin